jgi:2'-5' RNA ligase
MRLIRAFLAVPLPDERVRDLIKIRDRLSAVFPDFRWAKPETLHLTLKFFGSIPEDCLEKIGEIMLSVGHLSAPFQAELAGVGAFPSSTRPRVIWLGVRAGQPLATLHEVFDRELAKTVGIPRDGRPFTPHLTLGRSRSPVAVDKAVLEPFQEIRCGILPVDRVTLFESRLHPGGATHLPIKTVYLTGVD